MASRISRRTLLLAPSAPAILYSAQQSANDRIRLGLIGCGARSRDLLNEVIRSKENVAVTAVCDVWRINREQRAAACEMAFGVRPKQTSRYEELLAMPEVDAVLIATPDFTHPRILMDAVAAGKDAYVEKPFAIDFHEAKMAWEAVKRSRQIVQVGTQRRSAPECLGAAKAIQSGLLGKITRVAMEVHFQQPRWRRDYHDVRPEDVDWEAFRFHNRLGPDFDPRKLREWQLFRETTNGIPGLWMSHFIDLVPWFLNDPYPKHAMAMGGVYLWKDGRQTTDVFEALVEYNDCLVSFAMSLTNAAGGRNLWFGTKGTLDLDNLKISGEGSQDPNRLAEPLPIERVPVESHMANFLRCLRSRQTPRASVDAGFQHAVAACMASLSLETGRRTRFDHERLEIG